MIIFIGIIVSIIVFSIIILVHEYGHFKTARMFGVKVEEFGLGIPPRAKKLFKDKNGTLYSLNWLPLGGFVKLKGENINTFNLYNQQKKLHNNESLEKALNLGQDIYDIEGNIISKELKDKILKKLKDNYSNDSLLAKKSWQQAIIILAGVFMNFLLAFFILTIIFLLGTGPIGINNKIETNLDLKLIPTQQQALERGILIQNPGVYLYPTQDSIAKNAGIKSYDLVVSVDDIKIDNFENLKNIIQDSPLQNITLDIKRAVNCDITVDDNCEFENILISVVPNEEGKIGTYLIPNIEINKDFKYEFGFLGSIKAGLFETYNQIRLTFKAIGMIAGKIFFPETPEERQEAIDSVAGPIGIVDFMTKSVGNGIIFILIIGAIISINLGVFNLLPIPALDGGRFLFITINSIIQKIFGKKAINEKLEGLIHVGFFVFLIALSILIAYNDINRIINN